MLPSPAFFLPFLKYLFWSIAFLLQAFLSWLFINGTGSFTGFLFSMEACSSITDDITFCSMSSRRCYGWVFQSPRNCAMRLSIHALLSKDYGICRYFRALWNAVLITFHKKSLKFKLGMTPTILAVLCEQPSLLNITILALLWYPLCSRNYKRFYTGTIQRHCSALRIMSATISPILK